MNRSLLYIVGALLIIIVGFFIVNNFSSTENSGETAQTGYRDIAYTLNGQVIDLQNGAAESDGVRTAFYGNEAEGDLSEDGISDVAFLLTQERDDLPTEYYLVAAIKTPEGYRAINGVPLGSSLENVALVSQMGGVRVTHQRAASQSTSTIAATSTEEEISRFFVVSQGTLVEVED